MKKYRLTIITRNQNTKEKADKVAKKIQEVLNSNSEFTVSEYYKDENSYKIEFTENINDLKNSIRESIDLTDLICSPWEITFNRAEKEVELVFNKNSNSKFRNEEFNVISWANFQIEK